MNEQDPYIGETYQDKDSRSSSRRIRITRFDEQRGKYAGTETYGDVKGATRYYKASTLDKRYRKVSH